MISYVVIIVALVLMVGISLKRYHEFSYQRLGVFQSLNTTNCGIPRVAILLIQKDSNLLESIIYAVSVAVGFALVLVVFAGIRELLECSYLPIPMRGIPRVLISAGVLAMGLIGFSWIA